MPPPYAPRDAVRLVVPENPKLHGTRATVRGVYGDNADCLMLDAPAAATGQFRAHVSEVRPDVAPRPSGYSAAGEFCKDCGSANMMRAGSCLACVDCGSTTGCS